MAPAKHFFSEASNNTVGLPSFTGLSFTDNQYAQFQTRFIAYEGASTVPKMSSFDIGPSHYIPNGASISACGPTYTSLSSFSATLSSGTTSNVGYQLSQDGGSTWYYFSGGWSVASSSSNSNTAEDINSNISTFPSTVGTGTLCMRAYFISPSGGDAISIDSIVVGYSFIE